MLTGIATKASTNKALFEKVLRHKLAIANTPMECLSVSNEAPSESLLKTEARQKINHLFTLKLKNASTLKKCWMVYHELSNFTGNYTSKGEVLEKILEYSTTTEQCLKVYNEAPNNSPLAGKACGKANSMFDLELEKATTPQECQAILKKMPTDFLAEDKVWKRYLECSTTPDECWKVHNGVSDNSPIKNLALEKYIALADL